MTKLAILLTVLSLFAAACGTSELPTTTPIPPTISSTKTLVPSATFTPPTLTIPTATLAIIEGKLTTQVNVRSGPGTGFDSLGLLNVGENVQIVSQDSQKKWYQIVYPVALQGFAWVTAQYVQIGAGTEVPLEATSTPAGPSGIVVQRLNVRSGPGVTFDSLGLLEANAPVLLTGKNVTASWFQIDYPAGQSGRGWVTAQYIQTDATGDLPVLDDYGVPVTPGAAETLSGPIMTPTPTIGPAFLDGDSRAAPAIRVDFSAMGTRQFIYSSQVSAPQGDSEDWVEFTPYSSNGTDARLLFSLSCSGNGKLIVELWQGGSSLSGWGTMKCGDSERVVTLSAVQPYQMRLAPAVGEGLRLINYILTVQNNP